MAMRMFLSRAFQWYQQCNNVHGCGLTYLNVTNKLPSILVGSAKFAWIVHRELS
jgi:hypothetical protein